MSLTHTATLIMINPASVKLQVEKRGMVTVSGLMAEPLQRMPLGSKVLVSFSPATFKAQNGSDIGNAGTN